MRVLVDGLDLTGKTTLVRALLREFAARGHPAVRHRGMLAAHNPMEPLLQKLPLVRQPDSAFITTAVIAAGILDALLIKVDPPAPKGTVVVQDGYVDRAAAFGLAGGPFAAAELALRWPGLFARFDVAVYLHSPTEVLSARLATRDKPDTRDIRSAQDPVFAEVFTTALMSRMGRRHTNLIIFDTSRLVPEEMAMTVVDEALAAYGFGR